MTYAVRIHENGGPEKMLWEEVEIGSPGPGQVLVRNTAVGLNFIDVYQRTGLYPNPLPLTRDWIYGPINRPDPVSNASDAD